MQVKLLRAIQEKRVRPVGAEQEVAVDCRILSATHKDLAQLVDAGEFRQDLYYRINVIELKVPALRERAEDIAVLVAHFLERKRHDFGIDRLSVSAEVQGALRAYPFPGNVRELENVLERALTLCEGHEICTADLQLPDTVMEAPQSGREGVELQSYLDVIERQQILDALEQTRWNRTQAAKLLGISFRALRYRLDKLGIGKDE